MYIRVSALDTNGTYTLDIVINKAPELNGTSPFTHELRNNGTVDWYLLPEIVFKDDDIEFGDVVLYYIVDEADLPFQDTFTSENVTVEVDDTTGNVTFTTHGSGVDTVTFLRRGMMRDRALGPARSA